jgi:two-component system chemotaxis sensor kinase CheA
VRTLGTLGSVENLRPAIDVIKSGRYGRVVDADLESDHAPEEIARTLGAIPEIIEVRVQPAAQPEAAAAGSTQEPVGAGSAKVPAGQSSTIRVKTQALDRFVDAVGELILNKAEIREIARELDSEALHQALSRMEASLEELKRHSMSIRLTPLDRVFGSLPRMVRDLARSRGKQVHLEIRGGSLELDRSVVDALNDPLIHLLRNAVDHGVEEVRAREEGGKAAEGRILVEAYREKDLAVIHVEDDGRGIDLSTVREAAVARGLYGDDEIASLDDKAVLSLLFRPGMSTAAEVSDLSGRGVGLDAVKTAVQALGGSVSVDSRPGNGTQFTLRIPFSAAILRALIIQVGEEVLALPIAKVYRALEVEGSELMSGTKSGGAGWFCRVDEDLFPAWTLAELLGFADGESAGIEANGTCRVIVSDIRQGKAALIVDGFVGEEEVFVKPLGRPLSGLACLAGITVLGSGRPVFVLDPYGLGPEVKSGGEETESAEERLSG